MAQPIDWSAVEDVLFRLTADNIAEFAAAHSDETFYGFAFDCNADYAQVSPCLNSPEFHELAINGKHLPPEIAAGYADVLEHATETESREERAAKVRWSLGDWKYQDFSNDAYEDGWEPFEDTISDSTFPDTFGDEDEDEDGVPEQQAEATKEAFLRTVCRVVIRLEASGSFECLNRTEDFKACVIDHDEWAEDGWERLESVRKES